MTHFVGPIARGWIWPIIVRRAYDCDCDNPNSHLEEEDEQDRQEFRSLCAFVFIGILVWVVLSWVL